MEKKFKYPIFDILFTIDIGKIIQDKKNNISYKTYEYC